MKGKEQLGTRLVDRSPAARELWLIGIFVVLVGVAIATVLIPAIKNEHPNDDDGPVPAAGQAQPPPHAQHAPAAP